MTGDIAQKEMKHALALLDPGEHPKDQSEASGEEEVMSCPATPEYYTLFPQQKYIESDCTCSVSFLSLSLSR